jgi:hypothetical protein
MASMAAPEYAAAFFVLRAPFLPASGWGEMDWGGLPATAGGSGIREALWLGSPEFAGQAGDGEPKEKSGKKDARKQRALYRYLSRMVFRATPFGLFAGCSVGETGKETCLQIVGRERYERKTRLDFEYLHGLVQALLKLPEARTPA